MCLIIVALMLILLYGMSGEIDSLILSESFDGKTVQIAQGWELYGVLWQAGALAFLAGVLAVLLLMKLFAGRGGKDEK